MIDPGNIVIVGIGLMGLMLMKMAWDKRELELAYDELVKDFKKRKNV